MGVYSVFSSRDGGACPKARIELVARVNRLTILGANHQVKATDSCVILLWSWSKSSVWHHLGPSTVLPIKNFYPYASQAGRRFAPGEFDANRSLEQLLPPSICGGEAYV